MWFGFGFFFSPAVSPVAACVDERAVFSRLRGKERVKDS